MSTHRTVLVIANPTESDRNYKLQLQQDSTIAYHILTESFNSTALALPQFQQIDGILLELHFPHTDNASLLRQLKEQMGDRCPPIVVIDSDNATLAVQALKNGAADYLVKDRMTPDDLRLAMRSAIDNAELRKALHSSQEQFQTSVETMLDCFGIFSAVRGESGQIIDFRIDYLNESACENNRMSKAQQIGRSLCELLPGHRDSGLFDEYCRVVETAEPLIKDAFIYAETDGEQHLIRAFDIRASRLNDGFVASWRDVSDRKHMEMELSRTITELQRQEVEIQQLNRDLTNRVDELQSLFDIIPVGIAIATDPSCAQMQHNAYLRELLGVDSGCNISKSAPASEQPLYRVLQNGQEIPVENLPMQMAARLGVAVQDAEFDILLPDGTVHQLLSYASPLRDEQNQVRGVIGAFLDITKRNQDAMALRASQQRYRELAEAMPQMVWMADASGAVHYWNQRWYEYTGLNEAESLGLAGVSTVHPDDRDRTLTRWGEAIASGASFEIEYRIRNNEGEYHWFICRAVPTCDPQNQITGWIGTITNIDTIKRSEALVQQSEQQLQRQLAEIEAIYQSAPIGLNVLDPDLRFVRINQRLADINGLPIEAHIGRKIRELFPDLANTLERLLQPILKTGEPLLNVEIRGETPAQPGVQRTWLEHFLPLRAGDQVIGISTVCEEITERIQMEAALKASEERFRQMADNAPVMIWVTDPAGYCTYLNYGWCDFTGQTETTGLGFGWLDAVHPEDGESSRKSFLSSVHRQETFRLEYRLRRKDGEYRWVIGAASPWFNDNGELKGFIGSVIDISDRKQAEQALTVNEARLRAFVDANVIGILYGDIHGGIYKANNELLRIIGYTREDLQTGQLRWIDITPFEYLPLDEKGILEAQASGACTPYEKEYIRKDGSRVPVLIGYSLVGDTREDTVVFVLDLSDRKQAEAALRLSEERYRTLFESMDEGFCVIEVLFDQNQHPIDYRFVETNPAFERQTGFINVQGKRMRELVPNHEDYWFEVYANVLQTGIPSRFESRAEAMHRWYDLFAFRIGSPGSYRVAVLFNDISDRKQAEQEREKLLVEEKLARAEAEHANRIKDEFLAVLSHELRSPLNPILGWSRLLQTRKLTEAKTTAALATIERSAKVQAQLIDDLLDVAKILRGKLSLNQVSVNLAVVVEAAIETVRTTADAKAISLNLILLDVGHVLGDAARLQQIVWNLLSNAIKFTPDGGQVGIQINQVGSQAQIIVSDTGRGITPDFLPYIFESFRQEDASITRTYGGLGLGLAIARQLVEAHSGVISAHSAGEGLGATFVVQLPLLDASPVLLPSDHVLPQEFDLTGIRVLAVDDDPDARELLTVMLTQYGAEVLAVDSASEVLKSLETFQPDVLVSDVGMPEVDGYTLIRRVRMLPPSKGGQIPAIALTAYVGESDYQQAIAAGFQQHIAKPVNLQKLIQAIYVLHLSAYSETAIENNLD